MLQSLTKLGGRSLGEVVDTRSNGALVGKETRNATLVLGASPANEGRVIQETILGSVTLGLQGTEESLLGTENLDRGGGVLGQIGQATSVGNQTGTDHLSNKSSKVGSDNAHLGYQVLVERLAVLGQADNAAGESSDVLHVGFGDLLTHAVLGSINDVLSNTLVILDEGGQIMQFLIVQGLLVLHEKGNLGVALVFRDDLVQLGEVPRVPFANTHGESVDGLVKLIKDSNGLDDVVVVTLDGELDLGAGVGVTQTKLSSVHVTLAELAQQLAEVQSETTEEILDNLAGVTGLAVYKGESGLDASCKTLVQQTQDNLLLLARLREIQFKERDQSLRGNSLRDIVDFTQGLLVISAMR